jgi:arylsulfatase A-like enzyme
MSDTRPNFLIICTDQMRADHMGCAGNPVIRTPNLDKLAGGGVNFSRAYVNCPLCMPSRATMFTGMTPRGHRVRTNGIPLDPSTPTMPAALAAAGYKTASIGKIHLSNYWVNENVQGVARNAKNFPEVDVFWQDGSIKQIPTPYFGLQHVDLTIGHGVKVGGNYALWLKNEHPEQWERLKNNKCEPSPLGAESCGASPLSEEFHHTAYVAEQTIKYLNEQKAGQPFYLMCSLPDPHHPYQVPKPWHQMYSPDDVVPPVAREGELDDLAPFFRRIYEQGFLVSGRGGKTKMSDAHRREIIAYTYGMVSLLDKYVGRVLDTLKAKGLSENTVVLFLSDHGDLMGDHGLLNKGPFHFEGLLRVPMIWSLPGKFRARATQALASILDLAPTVLDLAGVEIPVGPSSEEAGKQRPPAWPGRSLAPVLNGNADTVQDSVVIENDEDYLGLRLRTLVTPTHKITTYTGHRGPESFGELFDLKNDPHELRNLWNSAEHASLRRSLIEQLHYRLTETDIAVPRRLSHA